MLVESHLGHGSGSVNLAGGCDPMVPGARTGRLSPESAGIFVGLRCVEVKVGVKGDFFFWRRKRQKREEKILGESKGEGDVLEVVKETILDDILM